MKKNRMFELCFENLPEGGEIAAEFSWNDEKMTVPGFYAGNGVYKVRFLPKEAGEYRWKTCGVVCAEGEENCVSSDLPGMVKADGKAFRFENGSLFHPFGTTVYALISQTDDLIEETMQSLEQSPFNKLRMCIFPKDYDFNKNEPAYYAFEKDADAAWDPSHPVYPFWDALDRHIDRLGSMGIQIDLILFHPYDRWGFDGMGLEKDKQYLDYLLRRLSAYPHIWWSLANEYELTKRTLEEWYEIEAFVASHDPYGHLLSCHNIFRLWDTDRPLTTHASIQSKDMTMLYDWCSHYNKPVMLDECCYEGNLQHIWGCITGEEMSRRFWKSVCCGAYCTHGETFYSDDEILWWARGGSLKGTSPERIRFCRNIIESLPGHLEGEGTRLRALQAMSNASEEEKEAHLAQQPDIMKRFTRAFWESAEAFSFAHAETVYYGHIGTDCYLRFYDTRPIGRDVLSLAKNKKYTVRLIDTWNMTIETIAEGVSGEFRVDLPGRENMAVLALAE